MRFSPDTLNVSGLNLYIQFKGSSIAIPVTDIQSYGGAALCLRTFLERLIHYSSHGLIRINFLGIDLKSPVRCPDNCVINIKVDIVLHRYRSCSFHADVQLNCGTGSRFCTFLTASPLSPASVKRYPFAPGTSLKSNAGGCMNAFEWAFQNGRTPGVPARTGDLARSRAAAFSCAQSASPHTADAESANATDSTITMFPVFTSPPFNRCLRSSIKLREQFLSCTRIIPKRPFGVIRASSNS